MLRHADRHIDFDAFLPPRLCSARFTLMQLAGLWRGEKGATLKNVAQHAEGQAEVGSGSKFSKAEAERIVQQVRWGMCQL